jgi:hypothetical protein
MRGSDLVFNVIGQSIYLNQMQKAAAKRQKIIEEERAGRFTLITVSALMMPVLLILILIFK